VVFLKVGSGTVFLKVEAEQYNRSGMLLRIES